MKDIAESQSQNSGLIKSIKIKAFVFIILWIICSIIELLLPANKDSGFILGVFLLLVIIISMIPLISLTASLQRASKSKYLLKNLLMATIITPLVILLCALIALCVGLFLKVDLTIGVAIFYLLFLLISFVYVYRYMKELAFITNQKLFMFSVWYAIVIALLSPFIFGANANILTLQFCLIPSFIMYIIAWVRFKEIRLSQMSAIKTPKVKIETFLIAVIVVLLLVFVVLLLNYM